MKTKRIIAGLIAAALVCSSAGCKKEKSGEKEQVKLTWLFGGAGKGSRSRGTRSRSARTNAGEMNANVNIDLYTALLGGEVILQLTGGHKIKLKVKPETQNGTKVRLRGKGYDRGDGTMGDLIITYNIMLPTNLSERQKQLLNEMRNA